MTTSPLRLSPTFSSLLAIAALVTACGDDGGGGRDIQEPSPVSSVTVTAPTTEILVGETVQLTATAHDVNGAALEDKSFEWTSGIGTVTSVSPTGLVTGLVKGQSEIRATTEGVTGSIVITIRVGPRPDPITFPEGRLAGLGERAGSADLLDEIRCGNNLEAEPLLY